MKKIILLVTSLLLLLAIPATIYLVMQRQELRKRAAPATSLSIAPQTITKNVDDEFTVEVKIDTGENQVLTAELHLTYDETKLEALSIANGPLFPSVLASGVVENGAATITVGAAGATTPVTGTGTVATLRLKALEQTDAPVSIRFDATTFVGGLGEGSTNILIGSTPATVTITNTDAETSSFGNEEEESTSSSSLEDTSEASQSAVLILSLEEDETVTETTPLISGKAQPGATVTVTIYSEPVTCIATADASGNWSCAPETPLPPGPHNVVVSAAGADGTNQTASTTIIVAGGAESASESATPIAGSMETTILLTTLGLLFIIVGITTTMVAR